jgi:RNase P subunit RPR2
MIALTDALEDLKRCCEQQALTAEEQADRLYKLTLDQAENEEQSRNRERIKSLREIARALRTIIEDV